MKNDAFENKLIELNKTDKIQFRKRLNIEKYHRNAQKTGKKLM